MTEQATGASEQDAILGGATAAMAMIVPWGTAAAAAITVFQGMDSAKKSEAAAEAKRDDDVRAATLDNRADNAKLQAKLEENQGHRMDAQLKALKVQSQAQNDTSGVLGNTKQDAAAEVQNQLSRVLDDVNRADARAKDSVALTKKQRNHSLGSRIKSSTVTGYDATSDILGATLKIGDYYDTLKQKTTEDTTEPVTTKGSGAQTVGGL